MTSYRHSRCGHGVQASRGAGSHATAQCTGIQAEPIAKPIASPISTHRATDFRRGIEEFRRAHRPVDRAVRRAAEESRTQIIEARAS